ncbi:MAG: ABC transporter substrate-binding protein, partial [Actinomycetota bacterium]|nr:ABC transporter substrate-binding protein [Actinomycetota bacterium]
MPPSATRRGMGAWVIAALTLGLLPSAAIAQASPAKLVRIPFPAYDGTLTPYTFKLGYPLVTLVYDTLLWRDAQGIPRPWLARSVQRSNGGRRVTVRLRKGVRWQDGRSLTADDVAFTFQFVASRSPRTPELA